MDKTVHLRGEQTGRKLRQAIEQQLSSALQRFEHHLLWVKTSVGSQRGSHARVQLNAKCTDGQTITVVTASEGVHQAVAGALASIRRTLSERSSGIRAKQRDHGRQARAKAA